MPDTNPSIGSGRPKVPIPAVYIIESPLTNLIGEFVIAVTCANDIVSYFPGLTSFINVGLLPSVLIPLISSLIKSVTIG